MNEYDVLQVNCSSTIEEIKQKYKQLAKKYHPNSVEGSSNPSKFIQIKQAYDYLLKNHKPTKSKNEIFRGAKYYRILYPKLDMFGNFRDKVEIEKEAFETDVSLICMWNEQEFVINLSKNMILPTELEILNLRGKLILEMKYEI